MSPQSTELHKPSDDVARAEAVRNPSLTPEIGGIALATPEGVYSFTEEDVARVLARMPHYHYDEANVRAVQNRTDRNIALDSI